MSNEIQHLDSLHESVTKRIANIILLLSTKILIKGYEQLVTFHIIHYIPLGSKRRLKKLPLRTSVNTFWTKVLWILIVKCAVKQIK